MAPSSLRAAALVSILLLQCFLGGFSQEDAGKTLDDMIGQPEGEDSLPSDAMVIPQEETIEGQPEGEDSSFPGDFTGSQAQPPSSRADAPVSSSSSTPQEDEGLPAAADEELSKKEALASLEEAQLYLERARVVGTITPQCQASLLAANGELAWCVTFLLESKFLESLEKLENAKKSLSQCSDVSGNQGNDTKPLAYLVQKVFTELAEAKGTITELTSGATLVSNEPVFQGVGVRESCKVDGTKCQFSSCGKGKSLGKCVVGFAGEVTGGARGVSYVVTSPDDNPARPQPGTFRYGVQLANKRNGGVWITFARSMTISLREMVWIRSSTTVDGRGVEVTFTNKCLVLGGVSNVILHNFEISRVSQTDTIHIFGNSRNIWVDHITSSDAKLGLVSAVQGSTDVTISNCFLSNKNFNMLLGASDADSQDRNMRITIYRNWFKDSMQRMPHCRWGYCHVVNNLYTNWGYYAIGGRANAQILSEGNVFVPGRRREVTPWFPGAAGGLDQSSRIQSRNDLYLGGSTFHQFLVVGRSSEQPKYGRMSHTPPVVPPSRLSKLVQYCSGSLYGNKLQRCMHSG